MEAQHVVNADRSLKTGRFLSTKPYWPKDSKKDIFRVKLTKDQAKQKKWKLEYYIVDDLPNHSNNIIWIIDCRDNCLKFTLEENGDKQYISSENLNMLKQLYPTIKVEFQLELRYLKWGVFYGIVWNEQFNEVVPRVHSKLYVKDILPNWILNLICENFKLSYLDGHQVTNYGVTSTLKKTPSTLKRRNQGSTSVSTSKKHQTPNKEIATRTSELMTIKKTLTLSDVQATRLYVAAEFTHIMTKAGVNSTWYVIGPPVDKVVQNFRFKLIPSDGRETELKIGGQWKKFCETYRLKEGTSITMKIKSIEETTMHITIT
ncbi:hypothetical protein PIB30_005413 [Stylosanthes scabra]|uniref:TF-B3 domain-containing protein n=1 Tax=Stylosanthes scabra TaxID=79078 RepID=A0ABU6X3R8_9FABA|nr:hypothetical protein [Stylosanthes scabra]